MISRTSPNMKFSALLLACLAISPVLFADTVGIDAPGSTAYPQGGMRIARQDPFGQPAGAFVTGWFNAAQRRCFFVGSWENSHILKLDPGASPADPIRVISLENTADDGLQGPTYYSHYSDSYYFAMPDPVDGTAHLFHQDYNTLFSAKYADGDPEGAPVFLGFRYRTSPGKRNISGVILPSGLSMIGRATNSKTGDYDDPFIDQVQIDRVAGTITAHGQYHFTKGQVPTFALAHPDGQHVFFPLSDDWNLTTNTLAKLAFTDSDTGPALNANVTLPAAEGRIDCGFVDPATDRAFFGTGKGFITWYDLGEGDAPPVRLGSLKLTVGDGLFTHALFDPVDRCAYLASATVPSRITKIALGDGLNTPTIVGSVDFAAGEAVIGDLQIDVQGRQLIAATVAMPGQVIKFAMNSAAQPPTRGASFKFSPPTGIVGQLLVHGTAEARQLSFPDPPFGWRTASLAVNGAPIYQGTASFGGHDPVIKRFQMLPGGQGILLPVAGGGPNQAGLVNGFSRFTLDAGGPPSAPTFQSLDTPSRFSFADTPAYDLGRGRIFAGVPTVRQYDLGDGVAAATSKTVAHDFGPIASNSPAKNRFALLCDTTDGLVYAIGGDPPVVVTITPGESGGSPAVTDTFALPAADAGIWRGAVDPSGRAIYLLGRTGNPTKQPFFIKLNKALDGTLSYGARIDIGAPGGELTNPAWDFDSATAYLPNFNPGTVEPLNPATIHKIALGALDAAPVAVGVVDAPPGVHRLNVPAIDAERQFLYAGVAQAAGGLLQVDLALNQKNIVRATRITLAASAEGDTVRFYSHKAAGSLRLAVYEDASPKRLLWQSASIANETADGWINVPVDSAAPGRLALSAGTYWLAWQIDTDESVPGYTPGDPGDGFSFEQPYGPFPAPLAGETATSERWSIALDYHASGGRAVGDYDDSGCTDLQDFLYLLDYWYAAPPGVSGAPLTIADFLNLLDNWQQGPGC